MFKEPRGELARYAFGYSDKKPGLAFWLILAAMVAFILYNGVTKGPSDGRNDFGAIRET